MALPTLIFTFFLGLFSGLTLSRFFKSPTSSIIYSETHSPSSLKYINPLLQCDVTSPTLNPNLNSLDTQIQQVINTAKKENLVTQAAVYFRDLNNGPWIGVNEKDTFSPASLLKVPLLIAYLKIAQNDPDFLGKELVNTIISDPNQQSIDPSQSLQLNQSYTIQEALRFMIVYSDNIAFQLLLQNIDPHLLDTVYQDLGIIIPLQESLGGDFITVKDYASFFRILYNSSYLTPQFSQQALHLLTQTVYTKGIRSGTPANIEVAHKYGQRQYSDHLQKQLHDCGVIYLPGQPYLLCIMTKGDNFDHQDQVIKDISNTVYRSLSSP